MMVVFSVSVVLGRDGGLVTLDETLHGTCIVWVSGHVGHVPFPRYVPHSQADAWVVLLKGLTGFERRREVDAGPVEAVDEWLVAGGTVGILLRGQFTVVFRCQDGVLEAVLLLRTTGDDVDRSSRL